LEVGDTAGLETCATKANGRCLEKSSRCARILTDSCAVSAETGLWFFFEFFVLDAVKHPKMKLIPIQVECYAGTRADETPRRFIREEQTVEVGEVLDRWHQIESQSEWPRADYFKLRGEDGHEYLLKHDLEADAWFLGRQW